MIVKILGILDLVMGLHLFLLKWELFSFLGFVLGIYLLLKSVIFISDVSSVVDLVTAVIYLLAVFGIYFFFSWIFALWLIQKGIFSLLS